MAHWHALAQMIEDSASDPKASTSGRSAYGSGVDVWAAAVLAYELLLGGPPFEADTKAKTYRRILTEDPFLPSVWSDDAHDFLKQVRHSRVVEVPSLASRSGGYDCRRLPLKATSPGKSQQGRGCMSLKRVGAGSL